MTYPEQQRAARAEAQRRKKIAKILAEVRYQQGREERAWAASDPANRVGPVAWAEQAREEFLAENAYHRGYQAMRDKIRLHGLPSTSVHRGAVTSATRAPQPSTSTASRYVNRGQVSQVLAGNAVPVADRERLIARLSTTSGWVPIGNGREACLGETGEIAVRGQRDHRTLLRRLGLNADSVERLNAMLGTAKPGDVIRLGDGSEMRLGAHGEVAVHRSRQAVSPTRTMSVPSRWGTDGNKLNGTASPNEARS